MDFVTEISFCKTLVVDEKMLILAIDRGWKSIGKSFKVSVLKLRRRTHSHNLWLLLVIFLLLSRVVWSDPWFHEKHRCFRSHSLWFQIRGSDLWSRPFIEGLTGLAGGSLAPFTNIKNSGSRFTDIKISFPESQKQESKILFLVASSYIRKSVWRKQIREWLSQGSILQIAYLYPPKSLSIDHSNHLENLRLKIT